MRFFGWIEAFGGTHEWIFQLDGVNDHLLTAAERLVCNARVTGLFDLSHGAGLSPASWPSSGMLWRGYAGGMSPDNVVDEIGRIVEVARGPFWIDMEANVRTNGMFDLAKARRVLELSKPFVTG